MSKRDKKNQREHKKKERISREEESGGGVLTSLRGGFKSVAGVGEKKSAGKFKRVWDALFWILIIAMLGLFAYRRLR